MNGNLEKLHKVDSILAKLVDGNDLTAGEAEKLTYNVFTYDNEGTHLTTFVAALHAKGETADELLGFLNAAKKLSVRFNLGINPDMVTDLSGTGGGEFKTINVSTASSFVVAAAGYTVVKAAYFGITSPTGSADIFTAFGVDFMKLNARQIENALKKVGISPVIVAFISPKLENRARITRKIYVERQLRVRSPFHLATNVYAPASMTHRVYGCYSERYLEVLANLFMKLGYKRTLTFHAKIGIPELSNVGETIIVEQNGNKLKKYKVKPSDLGVKEAKKEEIKTGGKEQNIKDFVSILKGKQKGAKADLVAINAGAALYALKDVKTLKEGTKKAQQILKSGKSYQIFEKLISEIGSKNLLRKY